jgi:hypothetical protein
MFNNGINAPLANLSSTTAAPARGRRALQGRSVAPASATVLGIAVGR